MSVTGIPASFSSQTVRRPPWSSGRVSPKRTVFNPSAPGITLSIGVFDNAVKSRGTRNVSRHGTLNPGSSKHGNARRAETASNCVIAYDAPPSSSAKIPRVELRLCGASNARVSRYLPVGSGGSNASPTNCSWPDSTVTRVPGALTDAPEIVRESALSHNTECGRESSTSIAISPGAFASPGTTVSVKS